MGVSGVKNVVLRRHPSRFGGGLPRMRSAASYAATRSVVWSAVGRTAIVGTGCWSGVRSASCSVSVTSSFHRTMVVTNQPAKRTIRRRARRPSGGVACTALEADCVAARSSATMETRAFTSATLTRVATRQATTRRKDLAVGRESRIEAELRGRLGGRHPVDFPEIAGV
jgi:hypothetical protein